MEKEKIKVLYDENGEAVRVQMDFEIYEWLIAHGASGESSVVAARR